MVLSRNVSKVNCTANEEDKDAGVEAGLPCRDLATDEADSSDLGLEI